MQWPKGKNIDVYPEKYKLINTNQLKPFVNSCATEGHVVSPPLVTPNNMT